MPASPPRARPVEAGLGEIAVLNVVGAPSVASVEPTRAVREKRTVEIFMVVVLEGESGGLSCPTRRRASRVFICVCGRTSGTNGGEIL